MSRKKKNYSKMTNKERMLLAIRQSASRRESFRSTMFEDKSKYDRNRSKDQFRKEVNNER